MFGSLSFNEILFIMVLALLIFGPKRLPQIGRSVGKALGEFRKATGDLKRSMEVEMTMAEEKETGARTATQAPMPQVVAEAQPRGSLDAGVQSPETPVSPPTPDTLRSPEPEGAQTVDEDTAENSTGRTVAEETAGS